MLAPAYEQHRGLKAAIAMTPPPAQQATPPPAVAERKLAPSMPRIPGVGEAPKAPRFDPKPLIGMAVLLAVCAAALSVWLWQQHRGKPEAAVPAQATPEPAIQSPPPIDKSVN